MTDKFKRIDYQEIRPKFGCSATPKDLTYFTEEENKLREEVRAWVIKEIAPFVDRIEADNDKLLAIELTKKMCQAGYSNQVIPKEYGGGGRDCVAEIVVEEEIGAVSNAAGATTRLASCMFAGFPLYRFGTREQKERLLVPLLRGEKISGMGLTEPGLGSDISRMETEAVRKGNKWVLNGEKRFIGNASVADYLMIFAVTNPGVPFEHRITAFFVETSSPGFEIVKDFNHMGWRGVANSWFRLKDVEVPAENVLGEVNGGFKIVMSELDVERVVGAAQCVGTMRSAYELAVKYSTEREQFGRKISEFEGVSFKLAEMYSKIETARLLTWRAARQVDLGQPAAKEAALAKWQAAQGAVDVTNMAFQVIGGIAYSKDYPIERYIRDSRIMTVAGGTNEITQFIIARDILREARGWPKG